MPTVQDVVIREACLDDAEAIAAVSIASWNESYRGIVPDSFLDRMSLEERAEKMRTQMLNPDPLMAAFVALRENRIVGFATGGHNRSEDGVYLGELYALYSLREIHGIGVGSRLVKAVAQALFERGMSNMKLWVLTANPARGFYEHLGAKFLYDGSFIVDGVEIPEMAYGWPDIRKLL